MAFLATCVAVLGGNAACQNGDDDATAKPSPVADPSPTPIVLADRQRVSELVAEASNPFRVDFALTSDDVAQGTVVWRQWNRARRLDVALLAPELHGGFEIETSFSDNGVPREGAACNWTAASASLLRVDCGVLLDAGDVAGDLLSTVSLGVFDRRLPSRSVLGVATQCFSVSRTVFSPGGEVCVEPTERIPLYYANESGAVLEASKYAANFEAAAFSVDLVARMSASATVAASRSDLELP